jgi:hypothetical protein
LVPRFLPSHSALFSPSVVVPVVVVPVFRTGVYLSSARSGDDHVMGRSRG